MNALTPLAAHGKGSFRASGDGAWMRGKASDSPRFRKEDDEAKQKTAQQRPRPQVEPVSQAETKPHDPFWDAPRLSPIFVTQLLGQVMEPERNRLVRTSYGMRGENSARLLDTRF